MDQTAQVLYYFNMIKQVEYAQTVRNVQHNIFMNQSLSQNFRGLFLTILKLFEFHIKQGLITATAFSTGLKKEEGGKATPLQTWTGS
jgi:hypothetical protein